MKFTNPLVISLVLYSNIRMARAQDTYKLCPDPPEINYDMISSLAECEKYKEFMCFDDVYLNQMEDDCIKGCYNSIEPFKLVFDEYDKGVYYPGSICKYVASTSAPTASTSAPTASTSAPTKAPSSAPIDPISSGGGDPHYTLQFNKHITVQCLCDLVLMDSPEAAGGMGVTLHARHATPKVFTHGEEYTFISNLALRIGDTTWELVAAEAQIFKDGELFDVEQRIDTDSNLYSVRKETKGRRANQVEYVFQFTNGSKISLRGNKRFKMSYLEVVGFSDSIVTGFLGRTNEKGFFNREGEIMADSEYIGGNATAADMYAQEWQVQADEPKMFMEKNAHPQAPSRCVFVDKENKEGNKYKDRLRGSRHGRRLLERESVLKAAANVACGRLSDSNPKKSWCIDDVMVTGEVEIATDSFYE